SARRLAAGPLARPQDGVDAVLQLEQRWNLGLVAFVHVTDADLSPIPDVHELGLEIAIVVVRVVTASARQPGEAGLLEGSAQLGDLLDGDGFSPRATAQPARTAVIDDRAILVDVQAVIGAGLASAGGLERQHQRHVGRRLLLYRRRIRRAPGDRDGPRAIVDRAVAQLTAFVRSPAFDATVAKANARVTTAEANLGYAFQPAHAHQFVFGVQAARH